MSQPQVFYSQQYVSGVVSLLSSPTFTPDTDNTAVASVVSRGEAAGTAKIQFWRAQNTPAAQGPPGLVYEAEGAIEPGNMWGVQQILPLPYYSAFPDQYWIVIWTTSPDLIPSCMFASQLIQDGVPVQTAVIAYVAPGDFAHFTLPHLRPQPGPPVPPLPPEP
jgi:hypothetical protein